MYSARACPSICLSVTLSAVGEGDRVVGLAPFREGKLLGFSPRVTPWFSWWFMLAAERNNPRRVPLGAASGAPRGM